MLRLRVSGPESLKEYTFKLFGIIGSLKELKVHLFVLGTQQLRGFRVWDLVFVGFRVAD